MASFIGTFDEFIKHIGPRARNVVNGISRKYKKEVGHCENCESTTITLEAAHVTGRERPKIIEDILVNFTNGEIITIDLDVFESKFLEEHQPIENNIRVLCKPCHRDYDASSNINNDKTATFTEAIPKSETPLISNSEITTFLRRKAPSLGNIEIAQLLDIQYCNREFGVNFPVLKEIPFESDQEMIGELARLNGYIRWSPRNPIIRNNSKYLVLTQWYDRNRIPFMIWKEDIENA